MATREFDLNLKRVVENWIFAHVNGDPRLRSSASCAVARTR